MISSQRLVKMAREWKKLAIDATLRTGRSVEEESCIKSVADKGDFVVYTIDSRRFMVPLTYLNSPIFIELLRISEEQFGLPCDGPITIPCDGALMEYVLSFFQRRESKDAEKALVTSIATCRCSTPSMLHQGQTQQQILLHAF